MAPNPKDFAALLNQAERQRRMAEAVDREKHLRHKAANDEARVKERRATAPSRFSEQSGEPLAFGEGEDGPCWYLEGRSLQIGDVIEVFTNNANSWVRGRFEWGGGKAPPKLAINLWDPNGDSDEDGLPPWIGELESPLPKRAVCRWPLVARGGD